MTTSNKLSLNQIEQLVNNTLEALNININYFYYCITSIISAGEIFSIPVID